MPWNDDMYIVCMCHQLTPCVAALETVSCVPNVEHDALGLTGRLEDKAAIVRKCALQLLSKLLCYNPFGQFLPLDQMTAVLQQQKAELQARELYFISVPGSA